MIGALGLLDNPVLVEVVESLRLRTRLRGLKRELDSGRLLRSTEQHHEILDALFGHDPIRTEDLMRKHIQHTRDECEA